MKFSIKDLVTLTEEILIRKIFCAVFNKKNKFFDRKLRNFFLKAKLLTTVPHQQTKITERCEHS